MWEVIRSFFIVVLLGFFTVVSAQLPPEIMVDKHLIHAEQLYAAKDYAEAFKVMGQIIALQQEHNLTLSDEFHFKYAQVALSADSTQIALESVTRYLSATGKEGAFYKEALALMLKAEGHEVMSEEDFYNEVIKAEGTCAGLPRGSSCWMELTNHPECYVWNDDLDEGETAIWSGRCSGHVPEGEGTLSWYYIDKDEDGKQTQRKQLENTGTLQKGKSHGQWVEHHYWNSYDGQDLLFEIWEGSYVDGKRHGQWVKRRERHSKWYDGGRVYKGPYVEGEKLGKWITHYSDGRVCEEEFSYVEGARIIQEVCRRPDGTVFLERSSKDGKWHGRYFTSNESSYSEETYVEGKKQGKEITHYSDGRVSEYSNVDGKWHGPAFYQYPNGYKSKGEYDNGQRDGIWLEYDNDEDRCYSITYHQGETIGKKKKVNKEMCR